MSNLGGKYFEKIVVRLAQDKKSEKILIDSDFKLVLRNQILDKALMKNQKTSMSFGRTWFGLKYIVAGGFSLVILTVAAFNFNNLKLLIPLNQYIPVQNNTVQNKESGVLKGNNNQTNLDNKNVQSDQLVTFAGASVMPPQELLHAKTARTAVTITTTPLVNIPSPTKSSNIRNNLGLNLSQPKIEPVKIPIVSSNVVVPKYIPQPLVFGYINRSVINSVFSLNKTLPIENSGKIINTTIQPSSLPDTNIQLSDDNVKSQKVKQVMPINTNNHVMTENNKIVTDFSVPLAQNIGSSVKLTNPVQSVDIVPKSIVSKPLQLPISLNNLTITPLTSLTIIPLTTNLKKITKINGNLDSVFVDNLIKKGFANKLSIINQNNLFKVERLESGKVLITLTENGKVIEVVVFVQDPKTGIFNVITSIK